MEEVSGEVIGVEVPVGERSESSPELIPEFEDDLVEVAEVG
jgi:hypothetical protein